MATALSPIVSCIAVDSGWAHPIAAVAAGVVIGFVMPPLAAYTYRIQNGMNLYNNGFSGGLIAIVLYPVIIAIARRRKPVLLDEDYFELLEHDEPVTPPDVHDVVAEQEEI